MKKIYLGIFLLSTVSFASGSYIEGKIGTDLHSEYGKEVNPIFFSKKSEKGGSFEIGFEFMKKVNDKVDIGLGVLYQKHEERKDKDVTSTGSLLFRGVSFDSIPTYMVFKYKLKNETEFLPYLKLNLGYSYNIREKGEIYTYGGSQGRVDADLDSSNGYYYSLGGGLEYKNLTFEIMYSILETKFFSPGRIDARGNYKKVAASLGYKFNF